MFHLLEKIYLDLEKRRTGYIAYVTIPADSQHLGLGCQIKVGWGGGKVGHGLAVLAGFAGPMSPPTKKNTFL